VKFPLLWCSPAVAVPIKKRNPDMETACPAKVSGRFPEDPEIRKEETEWQR